MGDLTIHRMKGNFNAIVVNGKCYMYSKLVFKEKWKLYYPMDAPKSVDLFSTEDDLINFVNQLENGKG